MRGPGGLAGSPCALLPHLGMIIADDDRRQVMAATDKLYPLALEPVLHTRVWGGRALETTLGKRLPTAEPYGESWEMHDSASIRNGPLAGHTVRQALDVLGQRLCGTAYPPAEGMPLLLKFLSGEAWLSVQVHPNDEQAQRLEGQPRGKTEAWVVLAARPGSKLVIGVQPGHSLESLRAAAADDEAMRRLLVMAPVQAGDVLFVSAGTIHALGPGILIYEIQQSSDTTYRLYDWGRLGLDGQPRALHVDKALAVAQLAQLPHITHIAGHDAAAPVVRSRFFSTTLHRLGGEYPASVSGETNDRFQILSPIRGAITVEGGGERVLLAQGETALLPAALGAYHLSADGPAEVLRSAPGEES
jgi:mannose-6-phosphate isomerase